ncbi:ankyrin repeat domain-containing protein [Aspergillus stella-maris]|uniref:ankyrin repeat domain-containing protein n=1 Tax=Aspergillus stella-maris TaxID=1810926 RepID=UPI003CCCB1F4
MKATQFNHTEVALLLIEHGADIHMKGPEGDTALSVACARGRESLVRLFLANDADPNEGTGYSTPLKLAIHDGSLSVCEMLLDSGALVQGLSSYGDTPLMKAAVRNELEIVKLLLDRGAGVNQQIEEKATRGVDRDPGDDYPDALSLVAMDGDVDMVKFLLSRGATVSPSALLCSLTGQENGPLESHRQICALVQPNDPTCRNAGNILVAAIHNVKVATHVLDLGIDVNAPGACLHEWAWEVDDSVRHFATALQAAAFYHEIETVRLLLDRGADVTIEGPPFGNALFAAFAGTMFHLQVQPDIWSIERKEALDKEIKHGGIKLCAILVSSMPDGTIRGVPWGFIGYRCFCAVIKGARELSLADIDPVSEEEFNALVYWAKFRHEGRDISG